MWKLFLKRYFKRNALSTQLHERFVSFPGDRPPNQPSASLHPSPVRKHREQFSISTEVNLHLCRNNGHWRASNRVMLTSKICWRCMEISQASIQQLFSIKMCAATAKNAMRQCTFRVAWLSISCQALSNCHSWEFDMKRSSARATVSLAAAWISTSESVSQPLSDVVQITHHSPSETWRLPSDTRFERHAPFQTPHGKDGTSRLSCRAS